MPLPPSAPAVVSGVDVDGGAGVDVKPGIELLAGDHKCDVSVAITSAELGSGTSATIDTEDK